MCGWVKDHSFPAHTHPGGIEVGQFKPISLFVWKCSCGGGSMKPNKHFMASRYANIHQKKFGPGHVISFEKVKEEMG